MKRGVVLASAPGALNELSEFQNAAASDWDVLAVNGAGMIYLDNIAAWGSVHADGLMEWIEHRRNRGGDMTFNAFGESFLPGQERESIEYYGPVKRPGSSALYVVQWALEHGYEMLVLAGVHLRGQEREREGGVERAPTTYHQYREGWRDALQEIRGKVYSLSGWTREFLGPPPDDWYKY